MDELEYIPFEHVIPVMTEKEKFYWTLPYVGLQYRSENEEAHWEVARLNEQFHDSRN